MIVIICAKYKRNPFRTVDATERTRFSKSRLNDLEDIGQGQRSSHATRLLMLVIICTKYGKNPSGTVDATGRTRKVNEQTDRRTDRQTDRQTGWIQYTPANFVAGVIIKMSSYQYRKSHCGDKTILRPCYLYNGIYYTGKMSSLYWIGAQYIASINKYSGPHNGWNRFTPSASFQVTPHRWGVTWTPAMVSPEKVTDGSHLTHWPLGDFNDILDE